MILVPDKKFTRAFRRLAKKNSQLQDKVLSRQALKIVRSPRLSAPPLSRGAGGIESRIYFMFNYNQLLRVFVIVG